MREALKVQAPNKGAHKGGEHSVPEHAGGGMYNTEKRAGKDCNAFTGAIVLVLPGR